MNFIERTIKRLKGEDDKSIAKSNKRVATSSINIQLSLLEGKQISAESDIEVAKEALENAVTPDRAIKVGDDYVEKILAAKRTLEEAEKRLADIDKTQLFWTGLLDTF